MLQARNLRIEAGGTTLLDGVSFTVRARDKVGLVGRNGAGKTTLLKVLAGAGVPASGVVHHTGGLGYLPQDPRLDGVPDDVTALTHVLSGRGLDEAATRLEKLRLAIEEDPSERNVDRFSRAEEQFGMDGGYRAEAEIRRLAAGLGLADDRLDLPIGVLSGGERRRVELVRILFAGSDLLLLDEPTNHLDTDAKEWLLGFLRDYRGALLVISHDLDLLDEAITRVLHLDRGGHEEVGTMAEYKGTYSQYLAQRAKDEDPAGQAGRRAGQGDRPAPDPGRPLRRQGHQGVDGAQPREAHRAHQGRRGRGPGPAGPAAGPLPRAAPARPHRARGRGPGEGLRRQRRVRRPHLRRRPRRALPRHGLQRRRQDEPAPRARRRDREPTRGEVRPGLAVSIGYYAQEHEGIDPGRTLLDHVRASSTGLDETELRGLLGMFGLTGDKVFQAAGTLSGGEKTKLALAQLVGGRHNVLLLDEPTNNLDPGSREAIAHALADWPGTIILVSHDTDFVRDLQPDRALLMPDGQVDHWSDGLLELVALA